MNIGIIVAMSKELRLLLPLLNNRDESQIDGLIFHKGEIGNNTVVAMQCGIGKVNAALGTLTMIKNFDIDLIINSGVAGGADKSVNVMDIVIGERVAYHDVYCGPESTLGAVQGLPLYFLASTKVLNNLPDADSIRRGL
ncbi:MAG: 5'-methylthioadenosine/S-adenosylhomocysteine nucleosidase, partial [Muribaculaceae bacterium]